MKFVFAFCAVLYVLGVATLLLTPTEVKTSVKPRVNKHIVHAPPIALFGFKCKFQHTKKLVTTTSLNDMTASLSLLLKRTVKILDSLKIKYTIGHGTLLGYERSGTFLPWDY